MVRDNRGNCSILFVLSDVNNSPQLLAILEKFLKEEVDFKLLVFAEGHNKLCADLDSLGITYLLSSVSSKYKIPFGFICTLVRIARLRPKALYASGQFATLISIPSAFISRVPTRVFTRHHSNFHHFYNMKLGLIADKISNRLATRIIAVSGVVKEILLTQEGVPQSKVKIIYNGIRLNEFRNSLPKVGIDEYTSPNRDAVIRIGVIARLTELKGVTFTAEAFVKCLKIFPNAHLSLVGARSDAFHDLSQILSNIPDTSYNFVDFDSDIPQFLNSLNILVHVPIAVDIESFGLVFIEALASGVPSIFTISGILKEIPDIADYVQIVPYMDSSAIYLSILNLLENTMPPKHLYPNALLSQFDIGVMADMYFTQILSN